MVSSGQVDTDVGGAGGEASTHLLGLIGITAQSLALLLEADEQEFNGLARRLQIFFDLVDTFPSLSTHKKPRRRVMGFRQEPPAPPPPEPPKKTRKHSK